MPQSSVESSQLGQDSWKQSMQVWHEELYDFGKLKSSTDAAKEVMEAGTTSVLACL
jgi:hypothetical protein